MSFITREDIERLQSPYMGRILKDIAREKPVDKEQAERQDSLTYAELIMLHDVRMYAFDPQSERGFRLDENKRIVNETLVQLDFKGYLKKHPEKLNIGKGKGQFQLYLLTPKAIEKYGKQNMKGKGSLLHKFWQYRCAKYFKNNGYEVKIEHFLPNNTQSVDVVAIKSSERLALEIEFNNSVQIIKNIKKCIRYDFDKIIIAVYLQSFQKTVSKMILSNPDFEEWFNNERITVELLSSFI
jgi:hypothetical protein